jgi:hypothetical protein
MGFILCSLGVENSDSSLYQEEFRTQPDEDSGSEIGSMHGSGSTWLDPDRLGRRIHRSKNQTRNTPHWHLLPRVRRQLFSLLLKLL